MSDKPETRSVCSACGHVDGAHLNHCRIWALEKENAELKAELEQVKTHHRYYLEQFRKCQDKVARYEKALNVILSAAEDNRYNVESQTEIWALANEALSEGGEK